MASVAGLRDAAPVAIAETGRSFKEKIMNSYTILKTKHLGDLLLVASAKHLTGIYFMGRDHVPTSRDGWELNPAHPVLKQTVKELQEYFDGKRTSFTIPLQPEGTGFQQEVWRQIARIPFGETTTYSELARRAGAPEAVRAAGTATGSNPISVIIPCHRVIGKDGALRGFAGGLDRKKYLLGIEAEAVSEKSFSLA